MSLSKGQVSQVYFNELMFRIIKIIDIAYVGIIYFTFAYIIGFYLDEMFVSLFGMDFDKKKDYILILEILLQIIAVSIITYVVKNLVEIIPFPLDGAYGFIHNNLKELKNGAFFTVFLVLFQYSMQGKIEFISKRYMQEKYEKNSQKNSEKQNNL
jgi:hypothetical protein